MKSNKYINNELEFFLYRKIKETMETKKLTNEIIGNEFNITAAGFSQRIKKGNYKYIFLLELFEFLNLDIQTVTEEFYSKKNKK
jgi:hypothetical protein